jgi:hypothetical protein
MPAPARKPPASAVEPLPLRPPVKKPPARETTPAPPPAPTPPKKAPRSASAPALAIVSRDPAVLLAQAVDELGSLEAELTPIRIKLRRVETLRELIRKHYEAEPAAAGFETRGARYLATLGPCAWQSTVDYDAVQRAIGLKAYASLARPTLKALEETLAPDVLARVVTWDYKGARPLKTFALAEK